MEVTLINIMVVVAALMISILTNFSKILTKHSKHTENNMTELIKKLIVKQ
jgi:hypothetical protein